MIEMQLGHGIAERIQRVRVACMPTTLDDWRAEQITLAMKAKGLTNVTLADQITARLRLEKPLSRETIGKYRRRETEQMATGTLQAIEAILGIPLLLTMESLDNYFEVIASTSNRKGEVVKLPLQSVPLIDPRGIRAFVDAVDFYGSTDFRGAPMITIPNNGSGDWAYLVPEGHPTFEPGKKIAISRGAEPNPGQYAAVLHVGRLELLKCLEFNGARAVELPDGRLTTDFVLLGTASWLSL